MSRNVISGDNRLSLLAPAKINLSLHVRGRFPDGYHALESLVAFADIGDRLELALAEEKRLHILGPFGDALAVQDNLVLQAHTALADAVGQTLPCHISFLSSRTNDAMVDVLGPLLPVARALGVPVLDFDRYQVTRDSDEVNETLVPAVVAWLAAVMR